MSVNTMTTIDKALKEAYPIGTFEEQFQNENHFYAKIQKSSEFIDATGRRAVIPLKTDFVGGGGWRAEGGALPTAGDMNVDNAYLSIKSVYQRGYITGQSMEVAENDMGAFAPTLSMLIEDLDSAAKKGFGFKLYRTSAGVLTQVNDASVSNETTFTVDDSRGIHKGMYIDVHNGSSYDAQNVLVSNVNHTTKLITVSSNVTLTDDAYIYQAGDKDLAMNGLLDNLATTGEIHGINKDNNPWWQGRNISSSVGDIGSRDLTKLRRHLVDNLNSKGDKKGCFWLTTGEVYDNIFENILTAQQRSNDKTTIAGGVETFTYHGMPFVEDPDCPDGYLFLIDPKKIVLYRTKDFHWIMNGSSNLHPVAGYDAVELSLKCYCNLYVKQPYALPYSYGITES